MSFVLLVVFGRTGPAGAWSEPRGPALTMPKTKGGRSSEGMSFYQNEEWATDQAGYS